MRLLESVPNFSEGRDRATIDAIGAAIAAHARLLDVHSDADHNRSVFTLVGARGRARRRAARGRCRRARADRPARARRRASADRRGRRRPGRADRPAATWSGRARARASSRGGSARSSALPVFLYGELAPARGPAFFRRGGTERARSGGSTTASWRRTSGRARLDERAGGVIVGARRPLIAFNVNLRGATVEVAREIAAVVRERDGGFPGVRALGLDLPRAGVVQVSMNVEDWEAAALHEIVARVEARGAGARRRRARLRARRAACPQAQPSPRRARRCGSTASTRRACSSCGCSTQIRDALRRFVAAASPTTRDRRSRLDAGRRPGALGRRHETEWSGEPRQLDSPP